MFGHGHGIENIQGALEISIVISGVLKGACSWR